jgi:hypothetical protein
MQKIAFVVLLVLGLVGCGKKEKKKEKASEGTQPGRETVQSGVASETGRPIGKVQVFLETSGSMAGYFQGSGFMGVVAKLPVICENLATNKQVAIHFINTPADVRPYAGTPAAFANYVNAQRGKLCTAKSSEIHNIFDYIATQTGGDGVSLFISDCILSFASRKTDAVDLSTLEANVRGTFQNIQRKGFAVSVYAFQSDFSGTYYKMDLTKETYTQVPRPYYVWALGKKEQLETFRQKIAGDAGFQPQQQLHLGFGYAPVGQAEVFAQMITPRGKFRVRNYQEVYDIEDLPAKPITFYLGCNLRNLPPYVQSDLNAANFKVEGNGIKASVEAVDPQAKLYQMKLTPDDLKKVAGHSHFVKIKVADLVPEQGSLRLRLPYRADEWFAQWNTTDDKTPQANRNKTFALANLVRGIQEAYREQQSFENFVDISVKLAKEN